VRHPPETILAPVLPALFAVQAKSTSRPAGFHYADESFLTVVVPLLPMRRFVNLVQQNIGCLNWEDITAVERASCVQLDFEVLWGATMSRDEAVDVSLPAASSALAQRRGITLRREGAVAVGALALGTLAVGALP